MLALFAAVFPVAARAGDTYTVDPVHSSEVFRVKHMNTSHAWGRFNAFTGSWSIDESDPAASNVEFSIKAGSVDTGNAKRDGHLKSPDFFNAVQYPTITFASTSVAKSPKGYEVHGDLTFHGVTSPIAFYLVPVGSGKDMQGHATAGFDAGFTIKQSTSASRRWPRPSATRCRCS